MRILYVAHNTDAKSGSNKSLITLLKGMMDREHDILVVCPNETGLFEKLQALSIPCISCLYGDNTLDINDFHAHPVLTLLRFCKSKYFTFKAFPKILKASRQFRPDIVHSNTSVTDIGWFLAKKLKCPHVWHVREYGDKDFDIRIPLLKGRIRRKDSYTICVSKDVARHHGVEGLDSNRIIYNGISVELSEAFHLADKRKYFLYASRCTEKKGFVEMLKAYAEYCNTVESPVKLVVTDTWSVEKTRMYPVAFANEKVCANIEWIGVQTAMAELYRGAIAVIVPSQCEAFGRVVAEAMAGGCLVIGKNVGGVGEQFDNGMALTGGEIGVRYDTVADLSEALQCVSVQDGKKYDEMRARAADVVARLYDIGRYCDSVESFYSDILHYEQR